MRGSLFPLLPLRVKRQNHERVPNPPISPILVVHVLSSCQDMGHQNRGNRDPLIVLALRPGKTLRGSLFPLFPLRVKCQNHERVPIPPISPILVVHDLTGWIDIDHQKRGFPMTWGVNLSFDTRGLWLVNLPPPKRTPLRNPGLFPRSYSGKPMFNKPFIRLAISCRGYVDLGAVGWLNSI